ncbi:hypothetical protein MAR_012767 [Mya arenaria]|uniref:dUTPase-like domain-containing protein n=1 Tax=Mya arenaria TaxID=6604 RepID=A0ABY7FXW7_MYAAR|nr:hypothetical protein MAR_012767 [Mya arenaria]
MNFEIDNEVFLYDFIVADLDGINAILGQDFLKDFDVNLRFGKAVKQIGKHKVKLHRFENNHTVPADSEVVVKAEIEGMFPDSKGLVEPYKLVGKKGLLMARTIIDTNKATVPISFINLTNQNIKIDHRTSIANIHSVKRD